MSLWDEEKEELVRLMRFYEEFCEVRVVTYCIMSFNPLQDSENESINCKGLVEFAEIYSHKIDSELNRNKPTTILA